jgi:chemotaxis protein MotB
VKYRRRKHRARVTHERWLVSYADFITLLFAFFVVMYSTAQVDKKKAGQLSAAIQVAFQQMGANPGGATPEALEAAANQTPESAPTAEAPPETADLDVLKNDLQKALAGEISRGEVTLRNGPDGLVVSLQEGGFFDSGSVGVKPGAQLAFSRMASILTQRGCHLRIEGHTDNVPIHNAQFGSNWELSTARATEMIRLLITTYSFSPELLSAAGYAEYHPIAGNGTDAGRALNRRVDVVILRQPAPVPGIKPSPSRVVAPRN